MLRPKKILTLVVDLGLGYIALFLALTVRHLQLPPAGRYIQGLLPFTVIGLFHIIVFYLSGLYTLQDLRGFSRRFQKTVQGFVLATGLAFVVFYLMPSDSYSPKTILLLYAFFYFLLFLGWRQLAAGFLGMAYPRLYTGFLGWDPILEEVLANEDLLQSYSIVPQWVFTRGPRPSAAVRQTEDLAEVEGLMANEPLDLVVVDSALHGQADVRDLLFRRLSRQAVYLSLPEFYEMVLARVPLNAINQMWFLDQLEFRSKAAYERLKRLADAVFALVCLVISLPFWPFIALAIKLTSRGPVFFTQTRSGLLGRPYTMYKFRTMRVDNNSFAMTVQGDSRITGVGSFLRKSRLDELPQLLNILRGEMSLVGPRPERPELIEDLEKEVPYYRQRMLVMPGLTGWDQVSGEYHSASVEDTYKKLQYDLYYIKNRSMYLDFIIVLKTIATVLGRMGR